MGENHEQLVTASLHVADRNERMAELEAENRRLWASEKVALEAEVERLRTALKAEVRKRLVAECAALESKEVRDG